MPNDPAYRDDPAHAHHSRWIYRPAIDLAQAAASTEAILCLFNLTEVWLRAEGVTPMQDLLSDQSVTLVDATLALPPDVRVWAA